MPWLNLRDTLAKFGRRINIIPIKMHTDMDYDDARLAASLSPRTRAVIMTHIHSHFGVEMNIAENIANIRAYDRNIKIIIDGTQAAGHIPIDMKSIGADFYCFSGHKMCALPGVGVLYAARRNHSELRPFIAGGGQKGGSLQGMLENGTPNMPAIISLGGAVKYLRKIGIENISAHVSDLTLRLVSGLIKIPRVRMENGTGFCKCRSHGICIFSIEGISGADLAYILDERGVCVRSDNFCMELADSGAIRASLYFYNTTDEIDRFVKIIESLAI
jgi:cysteine desulfurase/selenocysteine lyase